MEILMKSFSPPFPCTQAQLLRHFWTVSHLSLSRLLAQLPCELMDFAIFKLEDLPSLTLHVFIRFPNFDSFILQCWENHPNVVPL